MRPSRAGLSLLETLVCLGLFFLMLGAVVTCERTLRGAQPHSAHQSEVDRMALIGFEKVRTQLKGALVVPDQQERVLSFYAPERTALGQIQLNSSGEALYQTVTTTLYSNPAGMLLRNADPLAPLGERGWVSFHLEDNLDVLLVTVHAEIKDFQRELQGRIALTNQN